MTKLFSRVDSAATKGAMKRAAQLHASMIRGKEVQVPSAATVRIKTSHGEKKVSIQTRPGR
jgi:hypothetical protein